MQEKPTTVAAYAAGASLAAVALFYVFQPNYILDADDSSTSGHRKKSIVGLSNPANDCFINSVLQALAGLGDLRVYLIHELHRRRLDGPEIYSELPGLDEMEVRRGERPEKVRELQQGTMTRALKEMLDRLNERPIYRKTISAAPFLHALESAFRMRLSRNQQDAQEFLQIVAERLCEEYHAGVKARQRADRALEMPAGSGSPASAATTTNGQGEMGVRIDDGSVNGFPAVVGTKLNEWDGDQGFPFEGKLESQIECQFCHYQYKPNSTSFVNLTLQVPQKSSTTLNACFDGLLKTEYIEDFRCDNCLLHYAIQLKTHEIRSHARSDKERRRLEMEIGRIQAALDDDPECPPDGVTLPPAEQAPRRLIARHMRITVFPKIVAIHLSRSIFDQSSSTKNAAKVSFPERLPLGGILDQKWFKLLAIVCHKGSHQSGHYESFRRNTLYAPFATPDPFGSYAASRATSANPSRAPSPMLGAMRNGVDSDVDAINLSRTGSSASLSGAAAAAAARDPSSSSLPQHVHQDPAPPPSSSSPSTRPNTSHSRISFKSAFGSRSHNLSPTSDGTASPTTDPDRWSSRFSPSRPSTAATGITPRGSLEKGRRLGRRRQDKVNNRWWRISDEKIKECKTSDVLGMQKEVYLLFYELERE